MMNDLIIGHLDFVIRHFRFMRFDILTLFPAIFDGYLGQSLLKKGIDAGLIDVQLTTSAAGPATSTTKSMIALSGAAPA